MRTAVLLFCACVEPAHQVHLGDVHPIERAWSAIADVHRWFTRDAPKVAVEFLYAVHFYLLSYANVRCTDRLENEHTGNMDQVRSFPILMLSSLTRLPVPHIARSTAPIHSRRRRRRWRGPRRGRAVAAQLVARAPAQERPRTRNEFAAYDHRSGQRGGGGHARSAVDSCSERCGLPGCSI